MTYTKESLKKFSGAGTSVRTTYKVPTIKFNGNTGKFTKFPAGEYKIGEDITDVELAILRPRRVFTSYEKLGIEALRMFTNEHNTWEDHITVFEKKGSDKIKAAGSGHLEQIRAEFPSLRINSNLYCLYEGEIFLLSVKGKTRQNLVDTQKSLAKEGKEFFETNVKLSPTQESGQGGNMYYFIDFQPTTETDLGVVGPHMEAMGKIFDKMDEEYIERNNKMTKEAEGLSGAPSDTADAPAEDDMISVEEADSTYVDPENIPF